MRSTATQNETIHIIMLYALFIMVIIYLFCFLFIHVHIGEYSFCSRTSVLFRFFFFSQEQHHQKIGFWMFSSRLFCAVTYNKILTSAVEWIKDEDTMNSGIFTVQIWMLLIVGAFFFFFKFWLLLYSRSREQLRLHRKLLISIFLFYFSWTHMHVEQRRSRINGWYTFYLIPHIHTNNAIKIITWVFQ